MTPINLQSVIADLDNLPAAPTVVSQLVELLGRDAVDTRQISRLVAQDHVLAARSLSLANS